MADKTYSTSQFEDFDPFDESKDGLLAVLTPRDATLATDSEDDDAFSELTDDLSPGEAQRVLDTMRPLSEEEIKILSTMPRDFGKMRKVDDPEQEKWLLDRSREGYKAMDTVLDDASYGENMTKEEQMERAGTDDESGFGFGFIKKIGSGIKKGITAPLSAAKWAGRRVTGAMMRFIPGRDAGKAKMTKDAYHKMVVQHANWLGLQDQQAGRQVQSPAYYQQQSRPWALQILRQNGLPTSFAVSGADVLGGDILGADVMGSWYNPLSWFQNIINTIFHGPASQQMSPTGPDGTSQVPLGPDGQPIDPSQMMMPDGSTPDMSTYPDSSYQDTSTYPSYQDPSMTYDPSQDPYAYSQGDVSLGISGEDSLGAVTRTILKGPSPSPKADQMVRNLYDKLRHGGPVQPGELAVLTRLAKAGHPGAQKIYAVLNKSGVTNASGVGAAPLSKADQMVANVYDKLRHGGPIQPGELAVLAKLAKGGNVAAKKVYATLMQHGVTKTSGDDESGDWLYKLNPLRYILKSSEERGLEDKERQAWSENADAREALAKRQKVLDQAQKAQTAQAAVAQAKEQAAATEQQLRAIESSLAGVTGEFVGAHVGHEKPTPVSQVISAALAKEGKLDRAKELRTKIAKGEALDDKELADARAIAKILRQVKVVHGDIYAEPNRELVAVHGAFVGACMRGEVARARKKNAVLTKAISVLGSQIDPTRPLSKDHARAVRAVAKQTAALQGVVRSYTSGRTFRGLTNAQKLQRSIIVGAAAAMTPAEAKMLASIKALAKAGNPRAAMALKQLQQQGTISGGDFVGFGITDAFKVATAPIWWPTKQLVRGAKWFGQETGIVSKGSPNPEQVRLAKMRAAFQRRKAADAKAAAADAQTQAELRAQQSIMDAANAEAEAADAEALQKESAMRTAELEADPSQSADYTSQADLAAQSQDDEDSAGEFVGGWEDEVGAKDKKIVKAAAGKDAKGAKIRAGAKLYTKIKAGDPKAKASLKTMIARSQKGDQQATRDLRAVYAGMRAQKAKQRAQLKAAKRAQHLATIRAVNAKSKALQKRYEAALANKIVRAERKHELRKMSRIEKQSALGNKRAQKYVAQQTVLAQKGDKKAADRVAKMKLMRKARLANPTARDRRDLAQAGKLYRKAAAGHPKAVRQVRVIQDAARAGNPNAKRAQKRLAQARDLELVVAAGSVAGATAYAAKKKGKKAKKTTAQNQALVAKAKVQAESKTGSREELAAGSRAAQELGDKKTAGELALAAAAAPSATATLQKTAQVVRAKEAGNPEARGAIDESFEKAKTGDPAEIRKMGNVVATQTLDDIEKGKPVPPAMRDAVNLQERAAAGDTTAMDATRRITEAATVPNPPPEAIAAAITLVAAAVTAQALAAKPRAREEYMNAVNPPLPPAEAKDAEARLEAYRKEARAGTISAEDGLVAEKLAERLRKPKVAAEIAAYAPPPPPDTAMSSMPDMPQAPITGALALVKEALRALTFSTRDPFANYYEGIETRAPAVAAAAPAAKTTKSAGCATDESGWSPFDWFRRNLGMILPGVSAAASAATLALNVKKSGGGQKPAAPAPAASTSAPAATAPAAAPATPTPAPAARVKKAATPKTDESGADKTFKDYVSQALADKKISKGDFNRAVDSQTGASADMRIKTAVAGKLLDFLTKKGVKVAAV